MKSPTGKKLAGSSLKIKGRLIHQKDFLPRFQALCDTYGFTSVELPTSGSFGITESSTVSCPDIGQKGAVVMLSCKVHYNPSWGALHDHPQQIIPAKTHAGEPCFPELIDPFLRLYRQAQNQIYLTKTQHGNYLISLPTTFLNNVEPKQGCCLFVHLEKITASGENGVFAPVATCGKRFSFVVSPNFQRALEEQNFVWTLERKIKIGVYLTSDLFDFTCAREHIENETEYFKTLLPHLRQVVTHKTPHLRAAEIYLQHQFQKTIDILTTERDGAHHNLVCIAGLVIDMRSATGHNEQYFVPWKAYLEKSDAQTCQKCALDQDDLYVNLMRKPSSSVKLPKHWQ